MPRVLLTAFEPYDHWEENSSWLTLVELTRWFDSGGRVVTRRYPVDFQEVARRLREDLDEGYEVAIHLGQAPGATAVRLEQFALNSRDAAVPLVAGGPEAYRSNLPLQRWAAQLRGAKIPATLSYHAGTYLCNAALYLSHHFAATQGRPMQAAFIHLPLAPQQVAGQESPLASMSVPLMAAGLAMILEELLSTPTATV